MIFFKITNHRFFSAHPDENLHAALLHVCMHACMNVCTHNTYSTPTRIHTAHHRDSNAELCSTLVSFLRDSFLTNYYTTNPWQRHLRRRHQIASETTQIPRIGQHNYRRPSREPSSLHQPATYLGAGTAPASSRSSDRHRATSPLPKYAEARGLEEEAYTSAGGGRGGRAYLLKEIKLRWMPSYNICI